MASLKSNAQNINSFYYEAEKARKIALSNKIDSAIITYENAFDQLKHVPVEQLEKVLKLAKQNNDLEKVNFYSERIKIQKQGKNTQLISVLDSLIKVDQKVRIGNNYRKARYFWKCKDNSDCNESSKKYSESKLIADQWKKVDSTNTYFILDLIEKRGFIDEELVGPDKAGYVVVILLHFDMDTSNTVLGPILTTALKAGEITPRNFAIILDRHLSGDYTKQMYWTWPDSNREKYSFTQDDIPEIIRLRESIGIYGSELKQEYKRGYWIIRNTIH